MQMGVPTQKAAAGAAELAWPREGRATSSARPAQGAELLEWFEVVESLEWGPRGLG